MKVNIQWPGEGLAKKMWATLADNGIGGLLRPAQIRRVGRAEAEVKADEIRMLAQAKRDAELIARGEYSVARDGTVRRLPAPAITGELVRDEPGDGAIASAARSVDRLGYDVAVADTLRREVNVAAAILHAEEALERDTQAPPKEDVDQDWLFKWRDAASEVTSEHLQEVWGRVLAGEVKAPGSYSLRTLSFLRNLSTSDAEKIASIARVVVGDFIYKDEESLGKLGIDFKTLLFLQELGILIGVEGAVSATFRSARSEDFFRAFISNGMAVVLQGERSELALTVPVYGITTIGREVISLAAEQSAPDYMKAFGVALKAQAADQLKGWFGYTVIDGEGRTTLRADAEEF